MADKRFNLLLSIRHCWFLDKHHLRALHYPGQPLNTVEDVLTDLSGDGLIAPLHWNRVLIGPDKKKRSIRQPAMWTLTDAGEEVIQKHPARPQLPRRQRRKEVFEHDKRVLDTVVQFIVYARRSGLSGVQVRREVKLNPDPKARKPIADALLILEVGGSFAHADLVPWSIDTPLHDETLWRLVIEGDNDTESGQIIAAKAGAYRKVWKNEAWRKWWLERYGALPHIFWTVPDTPDDRRRNEIARRWAEQWPGGTWYCASDQGLLKNRWLVYEAGELRDNMSIRFPQRKLKRVSDEARALPAQLRTKAEQAALEEEARQAEAAHQAEAERKAQRARELALVKERRAQNAELAYRVRRLIDAGQIRFVVGDKVSYQLGLEPSSKFETVTLLPFDDPDGEPAEHRVLRTLGADWLEQYEPMAQERARRASERERREALDWRQDVEDRMIAQLKAAHPEDFPKPRPAPRAPPMPLRKVFSGALLALLGMVWRGIVWVFQGANGEHANPVTNKVATWIAVVAMVLVLVGAGFLGAFDGPLSSITQDGKALWARITGDSAPSTPAAQECGRWRQVEPIPLRSEPSLAAEPIIPRMTGIEVLTSLCTTKLVEEVSGGRDFAITWLLVRLEGGAQGWVNQGYLVPAEP